MCLSPLADVQTHVKPNLIRVMRTKLFLGIMAFIMPVIISSCSKEEQFDYPMETVYGKWEGTNIKIDDRWIDVTDYFFSEFQFSITFYRDGKYYGEGYFGTGYGTYKAKGNIIYTYVGDKPYRNYRIISLNDSTAELEMFVDGAEGTIGLKVRKTDR